MSSSAKHALRSVSPRSPRWQALAVTVATAAAVVGVSSAAAPLAAPAAGVDPANVELTLGPGASATVAKRVTTPEVGPNPDIIFLADTTGSMLPVLANVRNNVRRIATTIQESQPNARFGVAEYKEERNGSQVFRVHTPITSDLDALQAGTQSWIDTAGGGGDPDTDFINAHHRIATDAFNFRPSGTRITAWFGDARSHDPSLGHTLADANAALRAAGIRVLGVPVSGTPGGGLDAFGQATSITNATGGRLMPDSQADQVAQALLDGIQNLNVTVTPSLGGTCASQLTVSFDPASRTVQSGTDANFNETIGVRPDAAAGTYTCSIDFLVNGISQGFVQNITVHVPGLSIGDVTVTEGNSGTTNATMTIALDRPATTPVTVHWATADGTATAPGDFTGSSGDVTFAPGETSKSVPISVVGDTIDEPDETFTVNLSAAAGAAIADGSGVVTIRDDDGPNPRLSVGDVTVTEGNTGTTPATFTVTLDGPAAIPVTVHFATADGTAVALGDYTATAADLTFAPGETSKTVPVPVVGDTIDEADETFTAALSNATGATIADGTGVGTIVDDDEVPTLSIGDATLNPEGDSGTSPLTFTVTLNQPAATPVTVHFATADGTAAAPGDYTATTGDLTFAPGETSKPVPVPVLGDTLVEATESFTVDLSNAAGATIADGTGVGTIVDDDTVDPTLSINDVSVVEGNAGTTAATFTVTLNGPATSPVTVQWATVNGTAISPDDFTAGSGTLTFAPGETSKTVVVQVVGDTLEEADETFSAQLSNAAGAPIADDQGVGTIIDDDETPAISIGDVTVIEGNSGATPATFTVTLDQPGAGPVTVQWATVNGTATSPDDFTGGSGTVTFAPGQTSAQINIPVIGDTIDESDESFTVELSNASGATIADGQGVGTIIDDDDGDPAISIGDVTVAEGDSGTATAAFTVTLNHAGTAPVTVQWATANGTATSPEDFTGATGTLTFAPGDTSETVEIQVVGDTAVEATETFTVELSNPVAATIADGQGVGTIQDNDEVPTVSIGDAAVTEGNAGTTAATFTLTLSEAATAPVTVHFATADGTAVAPGDYTAVSGDATFAPGELSRTVEVQIVGDTVVESDETFTVQLSDPVGATIADGSGVGTIIDDDPPGPVLSVGDVSVPEGNTGTTPATVTVSLNQPSPLPVGVHVATQDGTAVAPGDYVDGNADLSFAPGETSKSFNVAIVGDTVEEPDETFTVVLSNATGATIGDGTGVVTIIDDDPTPPTRTLSISDATVTEGNSGTTPATFTVTLSEAATAPVTAQWATGNGTAVAPGDYASGTGTLSFAPGQTSQQFTVSVAADTVDEPDETFTVTLSNPTGEATIGDGTGVGTIIDDDRSGVFSCTASALTLLSSQPAVANPGNLPCRDDARTVASARLNLLLLSVRASGLTATTDLTPDDLSGAARVTADGGTSTAELASVRISALGLTIEVGVITATASASCVAGPGGLAPRFAGSSTIAALKINGVTIPVGSGPVTIPLVIGSLSLNSTVTTSTSVTQRAFALDTLLGDVIIGEARAGIGGNPCRS